MFIFRHGKTSLGKSESRQSLSTHTSQQPISSTQNPDAADSGDDTSSLHTITAATTKRVLEQRPLVVVESPASSSDGGSASLAGEKPCGQNTVSLSDSTSIFPSRLFPSANLAFVDDNNSIDLAASTRSLLELYLDYHEENGRRYCRNYYMPNDDFEQTRMYLNHQVSLQLLNGEPTTVPLENPAKILDIGCGTGEWTCQIGEKFPNCDVVGKDISAIQPPSAPHNVFFEVEDAEEPWLQNPDSVDLVHFRDMIGAFRDWRFIFEQAYECIRPGGYIELQETDDDGGSWGYICSFFPKESRIHRMTQDLVTAAELSGRPLGIGHLSRELLEEAGFVDIKQHQFNIPISLESGSAGQIWLMSCIDSVEALGLRLLTKYMNYDPEECRAACEQVAQEMAAIARDPVRAQQMRARIHIISGRKPDGCNASASASSSSSKNKEATINAGSSPAVVRRDVLSPSERLSSETVRESVAAAGGSEKPQSWR